MKMHKKLIVMEIDSVLADLDSRLEEAIFERFGVTARWGMPLSSRWADSKASEEAKSLLGNPNIYYGLDGIPDGIDFLENLLSDGHKVIYVSRRPETALNFTYRWLDSMISDTNITMFLGVKNKADFLSNPRWLVDFVVESDPDEIDRLKKAGFTVLCWEQPWNMDIFPRLYARPNGEIMLWGSGDTESIPFFSEEDGA
jgi:hypothetical protein